METRKNRFILLFLLFTGSTSLAPPTRSSLRLALIANEKAETPALNRQVTPKRPFPRAAVSARKRQPKQNNRSNSGVTKKPHKKKVFKHIIAPTQSRHRQIVWRGGFKDFYLCSICARGFKTGFAAVKHKCRDFAPLKYTEHQVMQTRKDDSPFGREREITIRKMVCTNCSVAFDFDDNRQFFHHCS